MVPGTNLAQIPESHLHTAVGLDCTSQPFLPLSFLCGTGGDNEDQISTVSVWLRPRDVVGVHVSSLTPLPLSFYS